MNIKSKLKTHFSKAAKTYDKYAILQREVADKLSNYFIKDIDPSDKIIDIGCGTGYIHEIIRKNSNKNFILQLDISLDMCFIARNYSDLTNTFTICSDVENIPICENYFDKIISSLSLQWTDYNISLNNLYNILNKDGKMFISTFSNRTLNELSYCFDSIGDNKRIIDFINKDEIYNILLMNNFYDIEIDNVIINKYHPDVMSIMKSLKYIGASYKNNSNYLSREKINNIDRIYRDNFFTKNDDLQVTWDILLIKAKK